MNRRLRSGSAPTADNAHYLDQSIEPRRKPLPCEQKHQDNVQQNQLATVTAGLIAAGALAATTTTASATGNVRGGLFFGGPGWSVGATTPGFFNQQPRWVCAPAYRRVPVWHHGLLLFRLVKVSTKCHRVWPRNRRPGRSFGW